MESKNEWWLVDSPKNRAIMEHIDEWVIQGEDFLEATDASEQSGHSLYNRLGRAAFNIYIDALDKAAIVSEKFANLIGIDTDGLF